MQPASFVTTWLISSIVSVGLGVVVIYTIAGARLNGCIEGLDGGYVQVEEADGQDEQGNLFARIFAGDCPISFVSSDISLPQDLDSTSTPTFSDLILSSLGTGNFQLVAIDEQGRFITSEPFANTDEQMLTLVGKNLSIERGNMVELPDDNQELALSGRLLSILGGNTVELPASTDEQTLALSEFELAISGGNKVAFPSASSSQSGWLSGEDYLAFSEKQDVISFGSDFLQSGGTVNLALTFGAGLARGGNTITNTFATGLGGSQAIYGGLETGGSLVLQSTAHAIKGDILLNPDGGNIGIGTSSPTATLDVAGGISASGTRHVFGSANSAELTEFVLNNATLPLGNREHSTVYANGFVYVVGGTHPDTGTGVGAVRYAPVRADGSIGQWSSTSGLPAGRQRNSAVVVNNYVYSMGGNAAGGPQSSVYMARINTDGTLSVWDDANITNLPSGRRRHTSEVANGHIYVIGGSNPGHDTIFYTRVNADGTINPWNTNPNPLPEPRWEHSSATANGYLYVIGGLDASNVVHNTVFYAKFNSDGSVGEWVGTTPLPITIRQHVSVVANGYVYVMGGTAGTTIYYAKVNADGTIGEWQTAESSLPASRNSATSLVINGHVYVIGGSNSDTIFRASTSRIQLAGAVDLVGLGGQELSVGRSGSTLTAGDTNIAGYLNVQDQVAFAQGLSVDLDIVSRGWGFFRNQTDSTKAFSIQNSSGSSIFQVDSLNSLIGIGTSSPDYNLSVFDNIESNYIASFQNSGDNANRYGVRIQAGANDASGTTYYLTALDGDGDIIGHIENASGTFQLTDISDIRTKTDVELTLLPASDILNKLEVVDFRRHADPTGKLHHGFVAQQVQDVFPYMVSQSPDGLLSISKEQLVPVLVKGFQEHELRIAELEQLAGLGGPIAEPRSPFDSLVAAVESGLQFMAEVIFEKPVEFLSSVTFNEVPLFINRDVGGKAVIAAEQDRVDVTFSQPLTHEPLINVTPVGATAEHYIDDVSLSGFSIILSEPAPEDIDFTWSIVTVEDPQTFYSPQ